MSFPDNSTSANAMNQNAQRPRVTPQAGAPIETLAQLRQHILAHADLTEPRRKAMASALNTVGRALRQPLESLPADPARLRPLLERITPAMARLKQGSWNNARSLLTAALALVDDAILPSRFDLPPSPAWQALLDQLRSKMRGYYLARFARYATQAGIEPEQVNDAIMARYTRQSEQSSLTAEPKRCAREAICSWNLGRETLPDWPPITLTLPDNRVRRSLEWSAYPASLQAEVGQWLDWLGRDLFADRDFRPLRDPSLRHRHRCLALYLGALVESGVEPATMTSLDAVVTPAMARRGLEHLYRRHGDRTSTHLAAISGVVLIIARHWAKRPADDIEYLKRLSKNLRPDSQGLAPRNDRRLAQLHDPRQQDLLINLPQQLAQRVRRGGTPTRHLALTQQTAVAIELLLMTALRISNLAGLRLGHSLLIHHDGRMAIAIPADQVKNGVAITADLPVTTSALLRDYLRLYRPLLGDPGSEWLFPGGKPGTQKTTTALRDQISGTIARECGIEFHPHLFRHFLAAVALSENAANDGLVTRALGHKREETTRSHYSGFQTQHALRHYDAMLERRRAQLQRAVGRR